MLFAFSIAPSGSDSGDGSVGAAVAEAVRVVRESGLPNETTSMFTTIESETWDEGWRWSNVPSRPSPPCHPG